MFIFSFRARKSWFFSPLVNHILGGVILSYTCEMWPLQSNSSWNINTNNSGDSKFDRREEKFSADSDTALVFFQG